MSRRNPIRIAGAVIGLSLCQATAAVPITGTFSGLAEGWRILEYGGPLVGFDNESISGTFSFETVYPDADVYPDVSSVAYFNWPVQVTFDLFGLERVFGSEDQGYARALILSEDDSAQSAGLYFFAAYSNAHVRFVAPDGGLFTNFDPTTLNPTAIDVGASSADFSANTRGEYVSMRFTDIRFDGTHTVPEPGTLALFGLGLLGVGLLRRQQGASSLRAHQIRASR